MIGAGTPLGYTPKRRVTSTVSNDDSYIYHTLTHLRPPWVGGQSSIAHAQRYDMTSGFIYKTRNCGSLRMRFTAIYITGQHPLDNPYIVLHTAPVKMHQVIDTVLVVIYFRYFKNAF